jgi:hypothetical protein
MVTPGVRREEKKPFFSAKAADFLSGSRRTQEAVPVQAEQPQPAATEPAPMARPQMRIEEESMVDESVPKADDDQLDIPAFIRKKMK